MRPCEPHVCVCAHVCIISVSVHCASRLRSFIFAFDMQRVHAGAFLGRMHVCMRACMRVSMCVCVWQRMAADL